MRKELLVISLFLIISNIAAAQDRDPNFAIPSAWSATTQPASAKQTGSIMKYQEMPESVSWNTTIGHSQDVDGGEVLSIISDGNDIYVGGDFKTFGNVSANMLVHSSDSGKTWSALDAGPSRFVHALALHDGKLYVGGDFQTVGSSNVTANYIAVWDGSSWSTLGQGFDGEVYSLAFVGDSLFAGGSFLHADGNVANYFAVWDGTEWTEASGGMGGPIYSLLATGDSLYVGGNYVHSGWHTTHDSVNNLALLNNDTWYALGDGLSGTVYSMDFYQGHLIAGGDYYYSGDLSQNLYGLAEWDGSAWSGFGAAPSIGGATTGYPNRVYASGDSLYVLGNFSSMAGVAARGVAMLASGTWSEVGGGIYGEGFSALKVYNGMMIGGRFSQVGASETADNLARWNGTSWATYGTVLGGFGTMVLSAVATSDKYAFFGGRFTKNGSLYTNHIAAWNKQTQSWEALSTGVDGDIYALAVYGDTLVAGGFFNHAGSIVAHHIAEWIISQKKWVAMGAGSIRPVEAIGADSSGIYASVFADLEGLYLVNYIGRWDGSVWNKIDGSVAGFVNALLPVGGQLYAGGNIPQFSGNPASNVLQYDGSSWSQVGSGTSAPVNALAFGNGNLYATGSFQTAGFGTCSGIAYWDGANWNPMGAGLYDPNNTAAGDVLAFQGGVLYVGGIFVQADGVSTNYLAAWNGTTFESVQGGTENGVYGMAADTSGLYIAGGFSWVNYGDGTTEIPSYRLGALQGFSLGVAQVNEGKQSLSIYPDPIINSSTVDISITESEPIKLELFNSIGEQVSLLVDGPFAQGNQSFLLNSAGLPNGLYFLRLTAGVVVRTQSVAIEK